MKSASFVYIWKYTIDLDQQAGFLAAYRPRGEWSQLFSRDPHYIKTVLLKDADNRDQYITLDYWTDRSARDRFRLEYACEFAALDQRCEVFTKLELFMGDYLISEMPE